MNRFTLLVLSGSCLMFWSAVMIAIAHLMY